MLKKYIKNSHLPNEELAKRIGISRNTLFLATHKDKMPTIETIVKIFIFTGLQPQSYLKLPIFKKCKFNLVIKK